MDRTLEGVLDMLVTGAFHGWFKPHEIQRMAQFYGVRWIDLVTYATDELGYDSDKEPMSTYYNQYFGGKSEYKNG
jgi:hypothetical protein|tara:strand:- start:104 stop:328 length:225 start_codon:yes stop_codon:yes gene_type:complete